MNFGNLVSPKNYIEKIKKMPKYISVIHIACVPKDGVQLCFRCGLELARYPLLYWETGHHIGQQVNNFTGKPTGGWMDFDAAECIEIESTDIDCNIW